MCTYNKAKYREKCKAKKQYDLINFTYKGNANF